MTQTYRQFAKSVARFVLEEILSHDNLTFENDEDRYDVTEAFECVRVGYVEEVEYVGNGEIVIHGRGTTTEYVEEIPATRRNPGDWRTREAVVGWTVAYQLGDDTAEGSVEIME